jgi:hypothetical protein
LETAVNAEPEERRIERSSHAIYGLIIITATLVADRTHAYDAVASLLVLWGGALVLLLAHSYAALLARLENEGHRLSYVERHVLIADNIPLGAAVVLPSLLLIAAALGWIELVVAIDLSIMLSVTSLFVLGAYQTRQRGAPLSHQIGLGMLGAVLGVVVIVLEVALSH